VGALIRIQIFKKYREYHLWTFRKLDVFFIIHRNHSLATILNNVAQVLLMLSDILMIMIIMPLK